MNSLKNCLKRGVGLSICPEVSVREDLASGILKKLDWALNDEETSLLMIWHHEKWCSPLLKQFMDMASEKMAPGR